MHDIYITRQEEMSLILQCCLRVHMGLYTTPRRKYYEWSTCSTSCTTTRIELLVRLHYHGMEDTSCGSGHPTIAQPPQQGLEHMRCQFWSMTSECHIRHGCAAEGCWKWEQAEIPAKFTMQVRRPTLHIPFCLVKRTIIKNNPQNQTVSPTTPPSSNTMEADGSGQVPNRVSSFQMCTFQT